MQVAYAVAGLLIATSCAPIARDTPAPEPQTVAPQPGSPQPVPKPVARPAPPVAPQPEPAAAPVSRTPPPLPPAAGTPSHPVATAPAPAPALDLKTLKARLTDTRAIGVFTKIALKNRVDDLLDRFRGYYQGEAAVTITDLRQSYDLLIMKVLSLLQDEDPSLASAIVSSREAIWGLLADPATFATLDA